MSRTSSFNNLQNYPQIKIDRGSVIKPCVSDQNASEQFIERPQSSYKKILKDFWHEGIPFLLRSMSSLQAPVNSNRYYVYLIRLVKYLAILIMHIHRIYLYIYVYFYPYSLKSLDEVCDEFSKCPRWSESVIRAFAWHPNYDRCAVAICNDYIYVYHGSTRIRILRHNHQRKIVDMVWHPRDRDVLAVATQTNIILWRVPDLTSLVGGKDSSLTYLAPGIQLIKREFKNDSAPKVDAVNQQVNNQTIYEHNFRILEHVLPAPIISIQFDRYSERLYACSPNSSRIAIINVSEIFKDSHGTRGLSKPIEYLSKFGQGVTRLVWSPEKNRLGASTTSPFFRVYEPFKWTHGEWSSFGLVQDFVWSKPTGRVLLIANKTEPYLYILPFLDDPLAGDVGGNKSLMKSLDLTATQGKSGEMFGGRIQSFAWDRNGKRLAISFKDNPESILLYRTVETPTIQLYSLGIIQSDNRSYPLLMEFHEKFKNGSLLTVCWSDGNCEHVPLNYTAQEMSKMSTSLRDEPTSGLNHSMVMQNELNSTPKTPRSLTNFCHVSGNNSISSYTSSLMPINKKHHQTTLFSTRSPLLENTTVNGQHNR